jgi:hypothetical protein
MEETMISAEHLSMATIGRVVGAIMRPELGGRCLRRRERFQLLRWQGSVEHSLDRACESDANTSTRQ